MEILSVVDLYTYQISCRQSPRVFTAQRSYASAVLGVLILSVRPSVRLSVCPPVRHTRAL